MRSRMSTYSVSRDSRKRVSYFIFGVIFLCCILNFAFMILPGMLYSGESLKVNVTPCDEKSCDNTSQPVEKIIDTKNDEYEFTPEHDQTVNKKYCNGSECKFLLAYYPPSMDTSINGIEFITYIKLAELLDRTIVLTNVGFTRISTCQRLPFDFYYDVKKLQQDFPKVKFISQQDFHDWSNRRNEKPSTSHYYLTSGGNENSVNQLIPYPESLKKVWCLDKFKLKLDDHTSFKQLSISWSSLKDGRNMLKTFLINNLKDDSEVLLVRHDTRLSLFGSNLPTLPYAKPIMDAASKIKDSLKPYIAVHWDIEHTKGYYLPICAPNLISKVQNLIGITQIENIYFASDYPLRYLDEIISLNSTEPFIQTNSKWRHISEFHTKAMQLISSTFNYQTADSLGVMNHLEETLKDEFENSGIRNIIDKLVCTGADWYVGLPRFPCNDAHDSKKSKIFVKMRDQIWKDYKNDENLKISKNVVRF